MPVVKKLSGKSSRKVNSQDWALPRLVSFNLLPISPENLEQAWMKVNEAVQIYSTERRHMALKNKTPDAVHRAF